MICMHVCVFAASTDSTGGAFKMGVGGPDDDHNRWQPWLKPLPILIFHSWVGLGLVYLWPLICFLARHESKSKDESLRKVEENLQNLESKEKGRDQSHKNLHEKINELEGQIELKASIHNMSEKQL
ncbi:hypothetical protein F2P56_030341 [Juglans regia]|uniref:Uncharacterized protein n=1 Tax=Juglans regia TaxID=51240 RepID=A0A833TJV5_JUGRE|nr:hypothetical protein F2P56_030341 [Juglans regia]